MGGIKPCCQLEENLVPLEIDPAQQTCVAGPGGSLELKMTKHVKQCRVCGCRHFRIEAEPGRIGLKLGGGK